MSENAAELKPFNGFVTDLDVCPLTADQIDLIAGGPVHH